MPQTTAGFFLARSMKGQCARLMRAVRPPSVSETSGCSPLAQDVDHLADLAHPAARRLGGRFVALGHVLDGPTAPGLVRRGWLAVLTGAQDLGQQLGEHGRWPSLSRRSVASDPVAAAYTFLGRPAPPPAQEGGGEQASGLELVEVEADRRDVEADDLAELGGRHRSPGREGVDEQAAHGRAEQGSPRRRVRRPSWVPPRRFV